MYLSIDLWDKRCWLAVEIEWVIIPKWIILRPKLISEIKKLINFYNITTIVVWLPYDLYGKELRQFDKTKKFIEKLKNIFPSIIIEWVDERFTSFEADYTLDMLWIKNKQWKKDDISAVLILESFFKKRWI
jgi:putative transcription antitermination factor YqgF